MRVLVLTNMYPPHHLGGYELSCRDVMQRWEARGHEIEVLTSTVRLHDGPEPDTGIRVRRELQIYWNDHRLLSPPLLDRLAQERHNQHCLRTALAEVRPDVVSVWNMGTMSFALLTTLVRAQVPMVYSVCDDWLDYGPRLDAWGRIFRNRPLAAAGVARLTRLPTRLPDLGTSGVFCFVSDYVRHHARTRTPWEFPHSTVVYSGIDPIDFPVRAAPDARPWRGRLLCVGRVERRKGFATAVRALAALPEMTLDIVGPPDPDYLPELQSLAGDLGVVRRVSFAVAPRERLSEHYGSADALLFTSDWEEPFGLVPIEAMACATPVVANRSGGNREFLVPEVNCLDAPRGEADALARQVRRLSGDPALRKALVESGLRTATELTVDALAEALELWHRAAADRLRGPLPPQRTLSFMATAGAG